MNGRDLLKESIFIGQMAECLMDSKQETLIFV
jgi:hypothetical protein